MGGENDPEDQCHVHHVEEGDELRHLVGEVVASHGVEATACYRRFSQLVTKYQEQAQLLDPLLEDLVEPLAGLLLQFAGDFDATDPAVITETSRFLWLLSTVRGYKVVLRFFPNAVAHFEPVVGMLGKLNELEAARVAGTSTAASVWEAQYVLLLWLSMLVLIPFHLSLVDSSLGSAASAAAAASTPPSAAAALTYPPIVGRIMELCRRYLASAGSVREMAAVVMGRLVTRPDMRGALDEWLGWGCQALQQGDSQDGLRGSFLVLGVALTFCTIFKLGKRDALLGPAAQVLPAAVGLLGSPAASGNALTRKLAVKLVQRIGLIFLRPRLAAWRYQKGRSTLLGGRGGPAAGPAAAGQAEQGGVTNGDGGQQVTGDEDAEEDLEHAEQIEGVVEVLLTGLGDRDTVVRWCAAKGVGRLTGRLPRDLAEDVVGSVLGDFFTTGASDTVWHGGCLAVAELARRGLLLPDRLPTVVPLVVHALEYDVRRGPCSVGAHVRDAAAYVLWAFARAYTPEALGDASSHLAPALITLACYDREVNCRRAAAAAFQECVGRLGSFPHGIQVLTAADYFTVSTRSTAYLSVAPTVASHAEYFEPMASHLLTVKLRHWEKALRELTATALAALVPHRPAYFLGTALPLLLPLVTDHVLEVRHGAVAGIAELLPALRSEGVGLPPDLARAVAEILPEMERSKVTRGKGGEVMRSAICRLIETCSRASLPLSPDQQSCLYGHLLDNLRHSSPDIQKAAATALGPFASHYLLQQQPRPQALQQTTLQFLGDLRDGGGSSPLARRGAALALGSLPRGLLEPHGPEVLAALAAATEEAALPPEARDAETRVNAVRALGHVAILLASAAVDGSNPAHPKSAADDAASSRAGNGLLEEFAGVQLSAEGVELLCDQAVEPLLRALEDYTLDNRGDVGSWVREAAMEQLTRLLTLLLSTARQSNSSGQPAAAADQTDQLVQQHDHKTSNVLPVSVRCIAPRVLLALLRQSVERISRVREAAASALQALLPQAAARGVAGADAMASVICPLSLEACVSGEALATVAGLLVHPSTQRVLLEGLAFSAGGLDNQLSTAAGDALAAGVQRLAEEGLQHAQQGQQLGGSEEARRLLPLAEAFVEVWEEAQTVPSRKARLATPLLAAGDVLLSRTPLRGALTTVLDASSATTTAGSAMGGNAPADREAAATEGSVAVHPPEPGAWGVAGRLLTCVRGEVRGCTDIPRLHLAAGLLCQLAELPQPVKAAALASTLGLLGNRYPKVRRYAAEQLYTSLLTFDPDEWGTCAADPDSVPDADAALDLLSSTAWDGPLENVRPARSQLFKCFRLPEPRLLKPGGPTAGQGGPGGDAEQGRQGEDVSYQSLIDRAVRGM